MKLDMNEENSDLEFTKAMSEAQTGGNTALKDLAVPAGLFFIQQAFGKKTPLYKESEDGEMMPVSLYDRLLELNGPKKSNKIKVTKKQQKSSKRKTKKARK